MLQLFIDNSLVEDRDANLWMGTYHSGVMRMARHGFITYGQADGFQAGVFNSIFETLAGQLCVTSGDNRRRLIQCFDGKKFSTTQPNLPRRITDFGFGWQQTTFQDHAGEWWVATNQGLFRFPKVGRVADVARTRPRRVYSRKDGLASNSIFRLYEHGRGDIWIATIAQAESLARWVRSTGIIQRYRAPAGLPTGDPGLATAFREDASGSLWIGFEANGGMLRYRGGGFSRFTSADGVPAGRINALYLDHAKRLWIASSEGGLSRLDNSTADRPNFVTYTTTAGLSSNEAWSVTEDRWGQIYIGTGRGVDRLDPVTGRVKHFTTADGLVQGDLRVAWRDRQGAVWFVTNHGISRLVPEPDRPQAPPPIWITGLRIRGVPHPMSELGETELAGLVLEPNQDQVQIDFTSLNFGAGESLRYQYKLEGTDRDWSEPTDLRTVNYASLSSGTDRFVVRAVNEEGVPSPKLAVVEFRVLRPVWERWWFLTLLTTMSGLAIYAFHRYRLARLLELERVRTRIATDLHDDIGSSLTQIAIMSEVARRQGADAPAAEPLGRIADLSRELVDSMSDIVWAINPKRDHLGDLAQRMRRFASDVLTAAGVELEFRAPFERADASLGADVRREVFLVFKESINNIARHSQCKRVEVLLTLHGPKLLMRICDDGQGFRAGQPRDGHGLASMRERARRLGGNLEVVSEPSRGTTLTLAVLLDR